MSVAFALSLTRALPQRTLRLRAQSPRRTARWYASANVADETRAAIAENKVMVFSTTYCPYCGAVKSLFSNLNVEHAVWDLDVREDGDAVRAFLFDETGQRTVPNVFVGGKHIGGCDDTMALHSQGKLLDMVGA